MNRPDSAPDNLAELVAQKLSDAQIAARCGVTDRTVLRWRGRRGLASQWEPNRSPIEHGTETAYVQHKCRCPICRSAHASYSRERNQARRAQVAVSGLPPHVKHGSYSAYGNWGCRCRLCLAVGAAHNAQTKANRKKRGLPG